MSKVLLRAALMLVAVGLLFAPGCKKAQEEQVGSRWPGQTAAAGEMPAVEAPGPDQAATEAVQAPGEALFMQHCAVCHPNGDNIINPEKPLGRASLERNGITSPADIVAIMRHPGPGMMIFDRNVISDQDAEKIAEYILGTF
jgi:cytochrome c6